jgi:two-component system NtrC family response regulator
LSQLVKEGKFRQDLYYRLASIPVEVPSLRSRPEDIRLLGPRFASEFEKALTPEALTKLLVHDWPGNVRELRHAIERACGITGPFEPVIHASDLDFISDSTAFTEESPGASLSGVATLREMEKVLILRALKLASGNRTEASRILGIARSTLFEKMKTHGIIGQKVNSFWMSQIMGESSERMHLPSR